MPVNTPTIIAATGWTTDELINDLFHDPITGKKFDIVTLLIGVNDQYQHLSQDNYRNRFQQVLDTAISFANGNKNHVFVLSIPDWGVTPFAAGQDSIIGPQIDQFNAINKQISTASGVNYLDITGISRQAANDPGLIASDGLHPSGKMYGQWVKLLVPWIAAQLTEELSRPLLCSCPRAPLRIFCFFGDIGPAFKMQVITIGINNFYIPQSIADKWFLCIYSITDKLMVQ